MQSMDDKTFLEGLIRMYQSNVKIKETDKNLDGSYFSKSEILDEQIRYINKYGEIDLPYTYEFHEIE